MRTPDVNLIDLDLFPENGENHQSHQHDNNGFVEKFATATMGRPSPQLQPVVQQSASQPSVENYHQPQKDEFNITDQPYIRTQQKLPSIIEHQLQYIKPFMPNLGNVPPPPPPSPPQQEEHNHSCGVGGCGHGNMCCRDIVSHMESCELCKRFHKKDDTVYVVIIAILIFIIVLLLNKKL